MKWDKVAMLILGDFDKAIEESAILYIKRYNIPPELVIADKPLPCASFVGKYHYMKNDILRGKLTECSKLIIMSHGAAISPFGKNGDARIVVLLQRAGISRIGLISFKGCNIGVGEFLINFRAKCNQMGICFGWTLAYRGPAATFNAHEFIDGYDLYVRHFSWGFLKLPDSYRIRIVRGHLQLPSTFVKTLGSRFKL